MDADRFNQIQTIFEAAVRRSAGDREVFLDEACGDDAALRQEVEDLLHHDQEAGELLDKPLFDVKSMVNKLEEDSGTTLRPVPDAVGPYKVLGVLGRGGVSVVYRAQQRSPRRLVALKVLESSDQSPKLLRRFERESHVLGQLEHPGIGRIYEAGEDDGRAYFTMELINGAHITDYCRQNHLTVDDRLRVFLQVCEAIGFAHEHDVVHRDLKPANILVDPSGRVKIVDFGIARLTSVNRDMTTVHTAIGQLLGTIPYMSPEQIAGRHDIIGPTSDIYSLGVILFELMVGRLPYDLSNKSLPEAARTIREGEPAKLGSISRELRGPLDDICGRMLRKDPSDRYQSAGEVIDAINLYLQHGGGGASTDVVAVGSRSRKEPAPRSHRLALAGLIALAILVVAFVFSLGLYSRSERNYRTSVRQEWITRLAAAEALTQLGHVQQAQAILEEVPPEGRDWSWRHLQSRLDGSIDVPMTNAGPLEVVAVSRDGLRIGAGGVDGSVYVVRLGDPEPMLIRAHTKPVTSLAFSEDGQLLASGSADTTIRLWTSSNGESQRDIPGHTGAVDYLSFGTDGRTLVSAGSDGVLNRWDVQSGALLESLEAIDGAGPAVLSPDGFRIARAGGDGGLGVWLVGADSEEATQVFWLPSDTESSPVTHMAWSPDAKQIAAIDNQGVVRLVDVDEGKVSAQWFATDRPAKSLMLSDDVVSLASGDKKVHRFNARTGQSLVPLIGHHSGVHSIAPAGKGLLVSASSDGTVRRWREDNARYGHDQAGHRISLPSDGNQLLTSRDDSSSGAVDLWSLQSGQLVPSNTPVNQKKARDGVFAAEGTHVFLIAEDGMSAEQWVPGETTPTKRWSLDHSAQRIVAHPRGRFLVAYGSEGPSLNVIDMTTDQVTPLEGLTSSVETAAFIPEGPRLITGHQDGSIQLWEVVSGQRVPFQFPDEDAHAGAVRFVRITPDQVAMVSGGDDGMIRVWSLNNLTMDVAFGGDHGPLTAATFHPSGRRLLTGGADEVIRVWDPLGGDQVLALPGHQAPLSDMTFTPDGHHLISSDQAGHIRLWRSIPE